MHTAMQYVNEAWDLLRQGFVHVNAILGLLIALYFAYRMSAWKDLAKISVGATLTHLIAGVMVPVIDHNAAFRLPPIVEKTFFWNTVALFLGYVVVVATLFFVKKNVLSKGGTASAH